MATPSQKNYPQPTEILLAPPQQKFIDVYHSPKCVPPPVITNSLPVKFIYPPGLSLLESLFPHNPVLSCLLGYLRTPALLCLYCTSRTLRYYLHGQRRLFRNLLLIPDNEADKWTELEKKQGAVKDSAVADPSNHWKALFRLLADKDKNFIHPGERAKIAKGRMWSLLKGHGLLLYLLQVTEADGAALSTIKKTGEPKKFFASCMSRHLYAILATIPIGRRLTTLVLDGTGVETEYMSLTLPQIEGTLRGLSVKHCPNLECYTWSEWLLGALEETRPLALQWLYIWGSGNTPTTDLDFSKQPLPLEPPEIHPDDPSYILEQADWNPRTSLFAKVIPMEFHLHNTLHLLPAMTCTHSERHSYMTSLRAVMIGQWQNYINHRGTDPWIAPEFPFGEPHPLIALLSITKYLSITVDISFCVSRRDCFSFVHGRPRWEHISMPMRQLETKVNVVNEATGRTFPLLMAVGESDPVELHTHCVAEIGARREAGGTTCQNCGLWEDELSPEDFRENGVMKEYAGIKWGTAIGLGRTAIGDCCTDCVSELTCAGCNSFYCPSCTFRSILHPVLPQNPLAAQSPGTVFLKWICSQHLHGPYCSTCIESGEYSFTCTDCDDSICYGCHGSTGVTVSSALYTQDGWGVEDENERFGVVGNISDWEIGAYLGWGGLKPRARYAGAIIREGSEEGRDENKDQCEDKDGDEEEDEYEDESDAEIDLPPPNPAINSSSHSWRTPTTSSTSSFDEMDPESWRQDREHLTSDLNTTPGSPSPSPPTTPRTREAIPDIDEMEFDTAPLAIPPKTPNTAIYSDTDSISDKSWAARINRMSETRIWEVCARCSIGICAGCLGYEEDMIEVGKKDDGRGEPEFRWCSGRCGRRFCDTCLNTPGRTGDLVCGGIWVDPAGTSPDPYSQTFQIPAVREFGMSNGGSNGKGRCGAVICLSCQEYELMLRPTICQAEGELEISRGCGNEEETQRRRNDRRGVWRCDRCELGMEWRPV